MLKRLLYRFTKALTLFNKRRGSTLAAASSFYVLITIVPFALLILRIIGLFLGDISDVEVHFFNLIQNMIPGIAPNVINEFRGIITTALFGKGITILNILILFASALGFINVIWNGIFLITQDKNLLTPKKHLIGLLIIGSAALLIMCTFALPPFLLLLVSVIKHNTVVDYFSGAIPNFSYVLELFDSITTIILTVIKSNFFYGAIFVVFFVFVYRWFFTRKLSYKGALLASCTFVSGLIIGKWLYVYYFEYTRTNLMNNYGSYYTFIAVLMWIFIINILFFFGICLCHVYQETNKQDIEYSLRAEMLKFLKTLYIKFLLFFKLIKNRIYNILFWRRND